MTASFGAELRRLRTEHGLSQRALAAAAYCSPSYLAELELDRKSAPQVALVDKLDEVLHSGGTLAQLADVGEPAEIVPPRPRPLGDADAAKARATTQHLVALDTLEGSAGLTPVAVRAFRRLADKLAVAGGSADARSAAADLGAAAAWIASDDVQRDQSRAIALEALALADMAGDARLHRFLLSHLSMVSEHGGRFGDALAYAERLEAENVDNPRVAAMIQVRRARALSGLGAAREALDAWSHAAAMLTASPDSDDGLTYWIHDAEMSIHKAIILGRAGDSASVAWAYRGIEGLPANQGRDQVLFRAILLHDAVAAKAWTDVPAITEDLLRYADDSRSARVPEQIGMARKLVVASTVPRQVRDCVRAVAEAVRAAR